MTPIYIGHKSFSPENKEFSVISFGFRNVAFILLFLVLSAFFSFQTSSQAYAEGLQMHVIDVWQGDSILLVTPSGKTLLVDAGEADYGSRIFSYLKKQGVTSLDAVVLTHPHSDHLGGLLTILKKMKVGVVYDSTSYYTQTYKKYIEIIKEKNIPMKSAVKGDTIDLDPQVRIRVMSPVSVRKYQGRPQSLSPDRVRSEINNRSIVLRVEYGSTSTVLSADAETDVEAIMVSQGEAKKCDLLKVGHHGSRTSSSKTYLKKLKPATALISVGKGNSFNHPHEITTTNLDHMKIETLRTDWHGNLFMLSDGTAWTRMGGKGEVADRVDSQQPCDLGGKEIVEALAQDLAEDIQEGDLYGFDWLCRGLSSREQGVWGEMGSLATILAQRLRLEAMNLQEASSNDSAVQLRTLESLLGHKAVDGVGSQK